MYVIQQESPRFILIPSSQETIITVTFRLNSNKLFCGYWQINSDIYVKTKDSEQPRQYSEEKETQKTEITQLQDY